jgi:hypothetical protein
LIVRIRTFAEVQTYSRPSGMLNFSQRLLLT